MSNWFTKRSQKGFLGWFVIWFVVFGAPQVIKFFIFDEQSLSDEWRALVYPLIIVLIFSTLAGFVMSAIERNHFAKLEKETESRS
ncbi:hypothetical protein [Hyphococcus sp.]|uniref:hypothetical protein n=1 Tax=Hyphococcus sp. TaxID=2038636 RepID=UPI0035C74EB7